MPDYPASPEELDQQIEAYIEQNWDLVLDDITRLVRIESVEDLDHAVEGSPFGPGPRAALDEALAIAGRMGFETSELDGYIGIADYEGTGPDHLAIIGHTDVVPAGPGWHFEPYDITRKDGYLVGRGTTDDKAPLLVAMHAVRFWIERGASFPYTVRILVGVNEETQMADVRHYLACRPEPAFVITPDAEFPVCYGEKGVINLLLSSKRIEGGRIASMEGGTAVNAIPGFASATVRAQMGECPEAPGIEVAETSDGLVRIRAVGKSAHASTPELGVNAIGILVGYILDNGLCSSDERDFCELMMKAIEHTDGSGLGLACEDPDFGPLTLACGIVDLRDGAMSLTLDMRFPTTVTVEGIVEKVGELAGAIGGSVEKTMSKPPFICDPDSPAVQALLAAYNEVTGEDAKPFTMGGGTYARMFAHGASFGIEKPWVANPDWVGGMHGPDEAVSEESLKEEFRIYVKTIEKLMKVDLGHDGPDPSGADDASRSGFSLEDAPLVVDGAMGTMLLGYGCDINRNAATANLDSPDIVSKVHSLYVQAGADCIITNSFTPSHEEDAAVLARDIESVTAGVRLARDAGAKFVLGDIGPSGLVLEPLGEQTFEDQYEIYRRHVVALAEGGPDAILVESFVDIADMRCAMLAARDVCDLPVIVSTTYGENDRTSLSSSTPAAMAVVAEHLGATVVGTNCGLGPDAMTGIVESMSAATSLPLMVQPNAGRPQTDSDGNVTYPGTAEETAGCVRRYLELGCAMVGSCCGSTPEFTAAIARELEGAEPAERKPVERTMLASMRETLSADAEGRLDCSEGLVLDCSDGFDRWDLFDELEALPVILRYGEDLDALREALMVYPGRAVVCLEGADADAEAAALAARYGAAVAVCTEGESAEEARQIALDAGIAPLDVLAFAGCDAVPDEDDDLDGIYLQVL